jgi:hypothetical protein
MLTPMRLLILSAMLLVGGGGALAQSVPPAHQHQHQHRHGALTCTEPTLACATAATPFVAPDGALWLAWAASGRVAVARSRDGGASFAPAVLVNEAVERVDTGSDARPRVLVDGTGRVVVSYAVIKDRSYNGAAFVAVSTDGGASFTRRPLTEDDASQRFERLALDPDGNLFAAWMDKRRAVAAARDGRAYPGAALAFTWLDRDAAQPSPVRLALDNTCECCGLGVGFAAPGRPVVLFRAIFADGARDHAVMTFADRDTPGPIQPVSRDAWTIDACPHAGPSLAIAPDGTYHVAWLTDGTVRQGLFYAHSRDGGRTFSAPLAIGSAERQAQRPVVLALGTRVWLAWKEFDGTTTTVVAMVSHDGGAQWSAPKVLGRTDDASDHPQLLAIAGQARLSWLTRKDGWRLLGLEDLS